MSFYDGGVETIALVIFKVMAARCPPSRRLYPRCCAGGFRIGCCVRMSVLGVFAPTASRQSREPLRWWALSIFIATVSTPVEIRSQFCCQTCEVTNCGLCSVAKFGFLLHPWRAGRPGRVFFRAGGRSLEGWILQQKRMGGGCIRLSFSLLFSSSQGRLATRGILPDLLSPNRGHTQGSSP